MPVGPFSNCFLWETCWKVAAAPEVKLWIYSIYVSQISLSEFNTLKSSSFSYSTWGGIGYQIYLLGTFGVTWDFDLVGWDSYIGVLTIMTLDILSHGGTWVEASSSPLLFSKIKCFISCPGFILLCWMGVSHVSTPSMLIWLAQEDIIPC